MGRRLVQNVALVAAAAAALVLSACSGPSGSTASPSGVPRSASVEELTVDKNGPCDKAALTAQAGAAIGADTAYVWTPLSKGRLTPKSKAAATSRQALQYVAATYTSVGGKITGCPGGLPLVNALKTGTSLANAAAAQLEAGTVNKQTLAGLHSIGGTVVQQAAGLGVKITPKAPKASELVAG